MTEITRVPLQPIAKGSLTKFWLGVIVAVLIGAGIAWASVPRGVEVDTVTAGSGRYPGPDDVVFIKYTGKLDDGTVFAKSHPLPFPTGGLIPDGTPMQVKGAVPGFAEGLQKMQKGGKYVLRIPAKLAYGANPPQGAAIPPNADLTFDVEMVDFMSEADARGRFEMLEQVIQQQQAQQRAGKDGGAPAAPPPAGAEPSQ
jgi:FKBP-type peptidyl-prolyl cis-trans isomerase FkpA